MTEPLTLPGCDEPLSDEPSLDVAPPSNAFLRQELAERDDVMALVAHELRNPLHVLSMQLSVARLAAEQGAPGVDVLSRVEKAQQTLARYTDRVTVLLDLVSARGGAYPARPQEVDLVQLLQRLVDGLGAEAKFRAAEIVLIAPERCLARLDPLILEQIIDNLLLNALKHAACTRIQVSLSEEAKEGVRIRVADNGRGISAADRDRVFGKFGVARQSDRGSGTGLGLWIVRKLSSALGGSISLNCPPVGGCEFELRCPRLMTSEKP